MDLTPQQVNEFLSNAILKSAIGEHIEKAIERVLGDLKSSYNNPFDNAIKGEIGKQINTLLQTEPYKERIRQVVEETAKKHVTDAAIAALITAVFQKTMRDY